MGNHEHSAKHDGTGRNHRLYEDWANVDKWGTDRDDGHSHDTWSRFDLVHDHGLGLHHHHLHVIDNYALLLYWGPAWHGADVASTQRPAPEWVLRFMEDPPDVESLPDRC